MARYASHAETRAALCAVLFFLALPIFGLRLWENTPSGTRGL